MTNDRDTKDLCKVCGNHCPGWKKYEVQQLKVCPIPTHKRTKANCTKCYFYEHEAIYYAGIVGDSCVLCNWSLGDIHSTVRSTIAREHLTKRHNLRFIAYGSLVDTCKYFCGFCNSYFREQWIEHHQELHRSSGLTFDVLCSISVILPREMGDIPQLDTVCPYCKINTSNIADHLQNIHFLDDECNLEDILELGKERCCQTCNDMYPDHQSWVNHMVIKHKVPDCVLQHFTSENNMPDTLDSSWK